MSDERVTELFMAIHSGNPREAPGSAASTRRAFDLCIGLPDAPRGLDLGCGPGGQTLDLAAHCDGRFLAIDLHAPYLERLEREAERRGLSSRIETLRADIGELDLDAGSFDLIWSEGAIYNVGFRAGLEAWRPLLARGGYMAVSEATWLVESPAEEVRAFWAEAYPAMQSVEANLRDVRDAGFTLCDHFTLPAACWHDYYADLEARMEALAAEHADDDVAAAVFAAERREIDLYRRHGDAYGYVFYVALRRD